MTRDERELAESWRLAGKEGGSRPCDAGRSPEERRRRVLSSPSPPCSVAGNGEQSTCRALAAFRRQPPLWTGWDPVCRQEPQPSSLSPVVQPNPLPHWAADWSALSQQNGVPLLQNGCRHKLLHGWTFGECCCKRQMCFLPAAGPHCGCWSG